MGVDLTKGFYFSFTYHLAATLQCNYQAGLASAYAAAAASAPSQKQRRFSSSGGGPEWRKGLGKRPASWHVLGQE